MNSNRAVNILNKMRPGLNDAGLLVLSFTYSMLAVPFFYLPESNPYSISNPFNGTGFNPVNTFNGIVFIIIGTILGFIILNRLKSYRNGWLIKALIILSIVSIHFTSTILDVLQMAGNLDEFHHGEQLSPASAFLSGAVPYADVFFLRGLAFDVLIPSLGFVLFGQSIGSFLIVLHVLIVVALICFLVFLARIIRSPLLFGLVATALYLSTGTSLVEVRDTPIWLFFALTMLLVNRSYNPRTTRILMLTTGMIASLTLFLSIDRGVLLFAAALVLWMVLLLLPSTGSAHRLNGARLRKSFIDTIWLPTGMFLGLLIPGVMLGWGAFAEFVRMTFVEIPRYGGLLVAQPAPPIIGDGGNFWFILYVAVAGSYLLFWLHKTTHDSQKRLVISYSILWLVSVLFLKAGLNRIDPAKMATVTAPMLLVSIMMIVLAVGIMRTRPKDRYALTIPVALLVVALTITWQPDLKKLAPLPSYSKSQLVDYIKLPRQPDDYWVNKETLAVRDRVVRTTDSDDYVFAFTSNPLYYYLTDRKNPGRFYASWFADPRPYSEELLSDLRERQPGVIIYSDGSWMDAPDTIPMSQRIPEVDKWIQQNYTREENIGDTVLLYRK